MALTEKKRRFATARANGLKPQAALAEAGYSDGCGTAYASRLERDAEVKAYIAKLKAEKQAVEEREVEEDFSLRFEDPIEYFKHVMNDINEDPKLRVDAAKALANFTVSKPGEKGKKEEREERAKKAANKFATPTPPSLKAVN